MERCYPAEVRETCAETHGRAKNETAKNETAKNETGRHEVARIGNAAERT